MESLYKILVIVWLVALSVFVMKRDVIQRQLWTTQGNIDKNTVGIMAGHQRLIENILKEL